MQYNQENIAYESVQKVHYNSDEVLLSLACVVKEGEFYCHILLKFERKFIKIKRESCLIKRESFTVQR